MSIITMNESYVTGKEQCPKCKTQGNDTAGDNLAVYSDGHKYCFGCGYYYSGKINLSFYKKRITPIEETFFMPEDVSPDIDFKPMQWLQTQCHFTIQDIINNKILWSNKYQWLVFPIEYEGTTLGFQARNFNNEKPYKWYTKFKKKDLFKVYSREKDIRSVVLVEDIISAIRVGNIVPCASIFGSTISDSLIMKIKHYPIDSVHIWLDADKRKQALAYSQRMRTLGLNAKCIYTQNDPKSFTSRELEKILYVK